MASKEATHRPQAWAFQFPGVLVRRRDARKFALVYKAMVIWPSLKAGREPLPHPEFAVALVMAWPTNCDKINVCPLSQPICAIVYASPNRLMQSCF